MGGTIVSAISPVPGVFLTVLRWLWPGAVWIWKTLTSSCLVLVRVLLLISVFALIGIITICRVFRSANLPEFVKHTEDMIHSAKWRWRWVDNNISDLWCFYPHCDTQLIYDDSSRRNMFEPAKTNFICERCNNQVIATMSGGDKNYAVGAAERKIPRRLDRPGGTASVY